MDSKAKKGDLYQYTCSCCGNKREGLLDHDMYSWHCPQCRTWTPGELVYSKERDGL